MKLLSGLSKAALAGAILALAGCLNTTPRTPPKARPAGLDTGQPSEKSQALARFYGHMQADFLTQGLLRADGGGPDTPFSADMLARNFERIAFYDEYELSAGLQVVRDTEKDQGLRRWRDPVRVAVEFGFTTPRAQQDKDRAAIAHYVQRLNRLTGHPITMREHGANFHVLFVSEDDRPAALNRIRQIEPNINPASLRALETMPRSIMCLAVAFADAKNSNEYSKAIVLIRAEHPPILREACIHEELAQALGLVNDSPHARPSIFNDDDEFARLTTHDEMLLRILYDRRLHAGMSALEARPIIRQIALELTGGNS